MRLDLIIRTSERKKDGQSPDQQRQQASAICAQGGHTIAMEHDSGRSESGKTMERVALQAAQRRIRAGETDGIVVGYLDRLGRAPIEESMTFVRSLVRDGGVLIAADWSPDPIDLSDPNTEDMLVFRLQMNRSQWTKAAERYRLSQANAIKAGKHVGPTPLGYRREHGRLHPHELYGPVITEAYKLAARRGLHAAIDHLERMVPQRSWSTDSTRKLLKSRTYLGESHSGVHTPNLRAHAPLTTPADWRDAQSTPHKRRSNGNYPLSRLAACGNCGAGLVGGVQTVRGVSYRRMRCSAMCEGGVGSINADALEGYVREEIATAFGRADFRLALEPVGREQAVAALADADERLQEAYRQAVRAQERSRRGRELADAEVDAAEHAYARAEDRVTAIAAAAADHVETPSEEEIRTNDAKLVIAIRQGVQHLRVKPGRGRIADRVDIVCGKPLDDLDDGVRMLAA